MSEAIIQGGIRSTGEKRLLLSIRSIKYALTWLTLWQDSQISGSVIQLHTWTGTSHSVHPVEYFAIGLFAIFVIERTLLGDFTLKRNYFMLPMMFILAGLFISWVRGSWQLQIFTIAYEVHEAFTMPFYLYLFMNLYRDPDERRTLIWLLLTSTIFKGLDGIAIALWSKDEGKAWGVLQMWRDGFLLAFGIVGGLHLLLYKGKYFERLRKVMIIGFPLLAYALILSYRRTFIVAMLVSVFAMFLTVGKGRRGRHGLYFFIMLIGLSIVILATNPLGVIGRLAGIIQPKQEGSAYIRLMELPNILQNIYHNPIFGTPIGVGWHQYYRMPTSAIFTLFGTHNTYLYWPLRAGLLGSIGFVLLVSRMWKSVLICYRLAKTEEDYLIAQLMIHMVIIYLFACFFGMMYGDAVTVLIGLLLTIYQLEMEHLTGLKTLKHVKFFATLKAGSVVLKPLSP